MKKYIKTTRLFLSIVWRVWDRVWIEEEGKEVTLRIDWKTAWTVAAGIHLDRF